MALCGRIKLARGNAMASVKWILRPRMLLAFAFTALGIWTDGVGVTAERGYLHPGVLFNIAIGWCLWYLIGCGLEGAWHKIRGR